MSRFETLLNVGIAASVLSFSGGLVSCKETNPRINALMDNAFCQKGTFRGYNAEAGIIPHGANRYIIIHQDKLFGQWGIEAHDHNINGRFDTEEELAKRREMGMGGTMREIGVQLPSVSALNLYANPDSLELAYTELRKQWEEARNNGGKD